MPNTVFDNNSGETVKRLIYFLCCFLVLFVPWAQGQETYGDPNDPVVARVYTTQIKTKNSDEMAYIIKQNLINRYAQQQDIQVTEDEIRTYRKKTREFKRQDREKRETRRLEIIEALNAGSSSEDDRIRMESELKTLNELEEMEAQENASGQESADIREAEREVAKAFIKQWKINQSLYRQYGGRVIYQQGGAEPLDAYRRFFENAQERSYFEIIEQDFEPAFWEYYTTDSMHSFYSKEEQENAITTPWWLMESAVRD